MDNKFFCSGDESGFDLLNTFYCNECDSTLILNMSKYTVMRLDDEEEDSDDLMCPICGEIHSMELVNMSVKSNGEYVIDNKESKGGGSSYKLFDLFDFVSLVSLSGLKYC